MKVDGTCHCGAISFEAQVEPEGVLLCHCTDCQTLTGSAYRAIVRAPAETFVLRGKPTTYVKTADSGTRRAHGFCPTCGTPVYATALENPTTVSLRVGTLRQRAELPPRRQQWCRSAVPWSASLEGVERREKQ
jgi:hypothetical protein